MAARAEILPARRPVLVAGWGALLAGAAAWALAQWVLVAALARLGPPELLGRYAWALAVVSPPLALANLQLRTLLATDQGGRLPFACYRRLRAVSNLGGLAAVAVATAVGRDPAAALEVALVAALKATENTADLYHGLLQRAERCGRIAALWGAKGLVVSASFVSMLATTARLWPALAAAAIAEMLVLFLLERPAALRLVEAVEPAPAPGAVWSLARQALAMGLLLALVSLLAALPRYLVEWRQGLAALGCYAALAQFPLALQAALGTGAQAAASRLAAGFRLDRGGFFRLTGSLLVVAAGTGALGVAATPLMARLAGWLYGPAYGAELELLGWLLAAGALSTLSGVLGTALTAARILWPQVVVYAAAVALCLISGLAWVDPSRRASPAQALSVATVVLVAGQLWLLARRRESAQ